MRYRMLQLLAAVLLASPAAADGWFQHHFGEMRSYHGDWLAVCEEAGAGQCRIVQSSADAGSGAVFDQRIAVVRIDGTPGWIMEVMDRNMPGSEVKELVFDFDGTQVRVLHEAWTSGDKDHGNAVDMVTIRDADIVADLLARMMAGNRLVVRYAPRGAGNGEARFPLRGVTSGVNAVQGIVLPRQE